MNSPQWFNDPKYAFYWSSLSNSNYSYSRCLGQYLRAFSGIKTAMKVCHKETCQQLEKMNCQMPEYIHPTVDVEINQLKTSEKITSHGSGSDVDDEYLKFYQEGLKYRQEYEKSKIEKQRKQQQTEESSFDIDWMAPERESELKSLYGDDWQKILWLETELQLKHDRNLDQYQPKYWPNFPLRVIFN